MATRSETAVRSKKKGKLQNDTGWALLMLAPNMIGFLMFTLIPVVATFVLSLMDYDILSPMKFIGLANYREMFSDPIVGQTVLNTVLYTLMTVPVGMAISLLLAVMLDQKIGLRRLYRAVYFLPSISSMVAVSVAWLWLFNPDFGIINYALTKLGLPTLQWLSSSSTSLVSIALVGIWKNIGYNMLLFLSGLQGISTTYYEASNLDGASPVQQFFRITIPMLRPTTFFVFIMSLIGSFQVFDTVKMLTEGGPGRSSSVLVHYLYQNAFQYFRMGYACAIAYLLFAIILVVTLVQMHSEKKMRDIF